MTQTFNLTAERRESRVLTDWVASRPGGMERAGIQNQTVTSSDREGMIELFQPIVAASGYPVTDQSAVQVSTVFACASKLGGAVQQLPINQYRLQQDGSREESKRNDLWYLLNESPAPAWTAASWWEWIMRCVAFRGDQHTEILRNGFGTVRGFKVHHPDYVLARRVNSRLVYDVCDIETGRVYTVDQDDMLHFPGLGFDGLRSLSMIQHGAKNGIGNALAAANYTGKSIGEGAMPQIALQYKNKMSPDQKQGLRESFVATYGGVNGRKFPLVLTEGGEAKALSISPVDMQLLESRQFEREDICQAMGVPPVLIGDHSKTSSWGTGIEQITLGFVKYTIKPHLNRWKQELNRKLFRNAGPFLDFDLDELLRGDSKAQAEADRAALGGAQGDGYKTTNEVRRARNLAPLPGGDELYRAAAKGADATEPAPKEGNE